MATTRYEIRRTGESSVSIEFTRFGLRKRTHVVFFERYHGEVSYDPEDLEQARFNIVIDAESMVCRDPRLTPQARQAVLATFKQMLDAGAFPNITFQAQSVQPSARHRAQVGGQVLLRGATASATLDATIVPVGKDQLELDLAGLVSLDECGVKPPNTWFGRPSIKDNVRLRLLLWPERAGATANHNGNGTAAGQPSANGAGARRGH